MKKAGLYSFYQLETKRAETPNQEGLRKLSFLSKEFNTQLFAFLWIDESNAVDKFQFFFFEKVVEWSSQTGLTTNITNRKQSPEIEKKIGVHKGARTLEKVDDCSMLTEALKILDQSVFPLGIKDILQLRMA